MMLDRRNDVFRSGRLSHEPNLIAEYDMNDNNWLMVLDVKITQDHYEGDALPDIYEATGKKRIDLAKLSRYVQMRTFIQIIEGN